ncbi:MAG: hypothetical protein KDA73_13335 [Rhodobacteraceae bacterium]|nr:hypothetical protein [Paracoccaceae bacterium]
MTDTARHLTQIAAVLGVALLAACGTRYAENSLAPEGGYPAPLSDGRPLVAQITGLQLERTAGGVIIRAEGLPTVQGYWNAGLVNVTSDRTPKGSLVYEFRARPPLEAMPAGTPASRRIEAAAYANSIEIRGISTITVTGAQNSRSARP